MNYEHLRENMWRWLGYQQTNTRPNYLLQEIKDNLNDTLKDIVLSVPYMHHHVREGTIAVVSGTSEYRLNDWARFPLAFWTEDSSGHKAYMMNERDLDRSGYKASGATSPSNGPFIVTWYPVGSASSSGASGNTTGLDVTEGSTSVSKGSSSTAWATGDTGSMLRIDGEDMDYTFTYATATTGTIDRAYISRASGIGTSGPSGGATDARWEMSPAGRQRITLRPDPTASQTLYYRYVKEHQRLLADDDVPDIPAIYLPILQDGAIARCASFVEKNPAQADKFYARYMQGLAYIKSRDVTDMDEEFQSYYHSPIRVEHGASPYPRGSYFR